MKADHIHTHTHTYVFDHTSEGLEGSLTCGLVIVGTNVCHSQVRILEKH
jgi:hypothetical protein